MAEDLPKDITDPERIDPTRAVGPSPEENAPEGGRFASYMDNQNPHAVQQGPHQPSPIDIAHQKGVTATQPPSMATVQEQMQSASGALGDIKNQLRKDGLKLKQSQKYLIRNKLTKANEHIRQAAAKTGVDPGNPVSLSKSKNPIMKFLSLVSDGQYQLNQAAEQVKKLDSNGQQISAGALLLIQVKLQKAQQELDYTSVLLGKSIDIIKTLFNIQI